MTLTKISASCLIVLSAMILLFLIFHRDPSDHVVGFADARILDGGDRLNVSLPTVGEENTFTYYAFFFFYCYLFFRASSVRLYWSP